jgi:5-methylcytosine-specific restriction endonuclease McrA
MKPTQKHQEAERVRREIYPTIVERDGGCCIVCGRMAEAVHEIIPRGRWGGRSAAPFSLENMCCICSKCHGWGQTRRGRMVLQAIMNYLYRYESQFILRGGWFALYRSQGLRYLSDHVEDFIIEQ